MQCNTHVTSLFIDNNLFFYFFIRRTSSYKDHNIYFLRICTHLFEEITPLSNSENDNIFLTLSFLHFILNSYLKRLDLVS